MRYLELKGSPPPSAPKFFRLVADSPHVDQARLLEWNASTEDALTALYAVSGDVDAFAEVVSDSAVVVDFELTRVADDFFYMLVVGRPSEAPLFRRVIDSISRMGLIIATPVVYREGTAHFRLVGKVEVLQSVVETIPPGFDVEIQELGTFPDETTAPTTTLSERQREAVTTAVKLGYYESPRRATHADIAERLDCAPNTATEHLQRAEAKLVRASLGGPANPPDR